MAVATALLTITAVTTKITDRKYLILGIIALLIIFYAVVINHTRAAILSIPIFFIVTVGFYWRHLKHMGRLVIFFAAIGLLILFFYPQSIVYQQIAIGISELRAFFDDPVKNYFTSWGLRPHMAHVAFLIFLSAPVFGTGLGDYGADAQALMDNGQTYILDGWLMTSAHNILLNTLAETGVVGLAAMLFGVFIVPGIVYIHNWQNSKTDSRYSFFVLGGIAILICFFVFGMFHTWLNVSSAISTFIILNLVFLSGIRHYRCKNELL